MKDPHKAMFGESVDLLDLSLLEPVATPSLPVSIKLNTQGYDLKQTSDSPDVADLDSWRRLVFLDERGAERIGLEVMDFESPISARRNFELLKSISDLASLDSKVGEASAVGSGGESLLVFTVEDKLVTLDSSLVDRDSLLVLARRVLENIR